MIYQLQDLLVKMGAPEVETKGSVAWYFFDKKTQDIGGSASLKLDHAGERLVAELTRTLHDYEDDDGVMHKEYTDHFHMAAERTARPGCYRITTTTFDGVVYDKPQKHVVELGLSIFHARALDINIRMMHQAFNKQDILTNFETAAESAYPVREYFTRKRKERTAAQKQKPATGVVVPFPRRA